MSFSLLPSPVPFSQPLQDNQNHNRVECLPSRQRRWLPSGRSSDTKLHGKFQRNEIQASAGERACLRASNLCVVSAAHALLHLQMSETVWCNPLRRERSAGGEGGARGRLERGVLRLVHRGPAANSFPASDAFKQTVQRLAGVCVCARAF